MLAVAGGSADTAGVAGDRAAERLRGSALFSGLDAPALAAITAELEWFSLPSGWTLFREGDDGDALYIVNYGLLGVMTRDAAGAERLVAEIHGGETVGEMALVSDEPRSATVAASRDTELWRLDKRAWRRVIERDPRALVNVAAILARRLNRTTHTTTAGWTRAVKTLALLPATPDIDGAAFARSLARALAEAGRRCELVEPDATEQTTERFSALEEANDLVIFRGANDTSSWTRLCVRQADRILVVAKAHRPPPPLFAIEEQPSARQRIDLILLHERDDGAGDGAAPWLDRFPIELVCHVRRGRRDDLQRTARLLTGRAIGLVLAGAGARGFAHLGVIRALREARVPIDLVGATSMGAIIAAGLALEWGDAEFRDRMRQVFVDTNPVSDYALPLLALARGHKVGRLLRRHFGEIAIEDLWLPYFCVSTSLTAGRGVVHRRGTLWRAVKASTAIPGLLPPVVENGEVLVDGGVVNNFPADIMAAQRRGRVIGVNLVNDKVLTSLGRITEHASVWQLLAAGAWRAPPIVGILMRVGTMTSDAQTELCRDRTDFLLEPPLPSVDLLDWKALDRAAELGYRYTMERLAAGALTQAQPLR